MQQATRSFISRAISRAGLASSLIAVLTLAACGGGGGTGGTNSNMATPNAVSSGTVTAFGSVFVNGHEFATATASVIDDDTGATVAPSALEVGMSVDVKPASNSTTAAPVAAEVHLHPLARGVVDGSDTTAGTLVVMGQSLQITSATNFSDHRACLTQATPCAPITGQSGLSVTSGSGNSAVAGSYVGVYGYLYASPAGATNIVATLISVGDQPVSPAAAAYKAEGVVTAVGSNTVTIGGLAVDLSSALCYLDGITGPTTPCASAFSMGQTVAAVGSATPALPAMGFAPDRVRLQPKLFVSTDGAAIELEGQVSAVNTSAASFVLRGITVDAQALTSGTLPMVGDVVEVNGTVATGGTSVTANTVKLLHAAKAATYGLEGDAASVTAGSNAGTWLLTVLGQPVNVTATTRLADRSVDGGTGGNRGGQSFNINTFKDYLAASSSQHLIVRAEVDSSGALNALSVTLLPASPVAAVGGLIDAAPVPINGAAGSTPTTFSVHGVTVSADPSAVLKASAEHDGHGFGGSRTVGTTTVAVGDLVLVRGTYAAGTLTVAAIAYGNQGGPNPLANLNVVLDAGPITSKDHDGL
jgi:hypothetical protein